MYQEQIITRQACYDILYKYYLQIANSAVLYPVIGYNFAEYFREMN
jgi:hypothetical protein